ncbi:PspC domain-containing protein [bacterium]|nr:PspC domain-containing protein [bacterium]
MAHAVRKSHPNQWQKTGESLKSQFDKITNEAKKLYRIENGRVLAGVCTGLADYFHIDLAIVRVIFVILGIVPPVTIVVVILYFIMALVLPLKDN